MSLKNIAKIFIVLAISYFLTTVLQQKIDTNYNYTKMNVKLNMFGADEMSELAYKKLFIALSGYAVVAEHFGVKSISERLNANIYNAKICKRTKNATKRNPRIQIINNLDLEINMIFTKTENAQKCAEEIKDYILTQKNIFFSELEYYMDLAIQKNGKIQPTKDKVIIITVNKDSNVNYKFSEMDLNETQKEFLNLKLSDMFKTTVNTSESNMIFELQYLFILIASILFLIMYKKEVVRKFNIIKKKLK